MFTDLRTQSPSSWRFTRHARMRAAEHGITTAALNAALTDPEITHAQPSYGPNRHVIQHGEIGVVIDVATATVITVLFRDPARWLALSGRGLAA